jgi:hypothetical protein
VDELPGDLKIILGLDNGLSSLDLLEREAEFLLSGDLSG